jgi:hypothetical protein
MDRKTAQILIAACRAFGDCEEEKLPTNAITLWRQIVAGVNRAAKVIDELAEK